MSRGVRSRRRRRRRRAGRAPARRQPALRQDVRRSTPSPSTFPAGLHGRADRPGRRRQVEPAGADRRRARASRRASVEVLGGDMADARHRRARLPAHRLHAAGPGKNLYPTLSVLREHRLLRPPVRPRPAPSAQRRIAELLQATGLAPFADRPAGKLSGGMKQKLGLCCALIHDPGPADPRRADHRRRSAVAPPVLGADRRASARGRPGMSVLVATAYMEEAARFDWLVAMDAGRVLATGTPARAAGAHRHAHRWRRPSSPCCRRRSARRPPARS